MWLHSYLINLFCVYFSVCYCEPLNFNKYIDLSGTSNISISLYYFISWYYITYLYITLKNWKDYGIILVWTIQWTEEPGSVLIFFFCLWSLKEQNMTDWLNTLLVICYFPVFISLVLRSHKLENSNIDLDSSLNLPLLSPQYSFLPLRFYLEIILEIILEMYSWNTSFWSFFILFPCFANSVLINAYK